MKILSDTVDAVSEVHKSGYLHNDTKGNNVIVEKAGNNVYTAFVINFGKARKISDPKIYCLSKLDISFYKEKFKHIALELLQGHPQSCKSDVL